MTPRQQAAAKAVRLRQTEGLTFQAISDRLGVPLRTVADWCSGVQAQPRRVTKVNDTTRIAWDDADGSWRIQVYERDNSRGPFRHGRVVTWWSILWLRFATCEAAEQHLALRGCP